MANKLWFMFVLGCVLFPLSGFAQEIVPRNFDGGYFNAGIISARTNKHIALFLDPSRTTFPASRSNSDEVINSVAANASDFASLFNLITILTDNDVIQGKAAKGMLHIMLVPIEGTSVIDKTTIQDPQTFQPGALKSLKEVKAKYGEPSEQEVWSSKIAKDLGLNGVVYWWGSVGVAVNAGGSITHVLLRMEPKK